MTRNDAARRPENHVIVLFGATGDLARRKLLPGLFHLHAAGLLPREYRVIGSAPAAFALTGRQFRAHAQEAAEKFGMTKPDDPSWTDFEQRLSFAIAEPGNVGDLQAVVRRAEAEIGGSPRRLFHLAIPPEAFTSMVGMLGDSGLAHGATRVIIEKPFGTDLDSARTLNQAVHAVAMGASCQVITLGFHRPPLRMFRAHFPTPSAGSTRSSSTSPIPARSAPSSWSRCPGRRCAWAVRRWRSATRTPSLCRTRWRATSGSSCSP